MTGAQDFDSSILVFEGESKTGMLLRVSHDAEGSLMYETEEVADATVARGVDVILIDMKFRGIGEVVESLRAWSEAPIIITSIGYGHDQSQTAVDYAEFSSGPQFHSGELLVEIRDALKCLVPDDSTVIAKTGELSLNLSDRSVFVRGDPVMLTPTEYELLKLLVINAGHVVTHEQLLGRHRRSRHHPTEDHDPAPQGEDRARSFQACLRKESAGSRLPAGGAWQDQVSGKCLSLSTGVSSSRGNRTRSCAPRRCSPASCRS